MLSFRVRHCSIICRISSGLFRPDDKPPLPYPRFTARDLRRGANESWRDFFLLLFTLESRLESFSFPPPFSSVLLIGFLGSALRSLFHDLRLVTKLAARPAFPMLHVGTSDSLVTSATTTASKRRTTLLYQI